MRWGRSWGRSWDSGGAVCPYCDGYEVGSGRIGILARQQKPIAAAKDCRPCSGRTDAGPSATPIRWLSRTPSTLKWAAIAVKIIVYSASDQDGRRVAAPPPRVRRPECAATSAGECAATSAGVIAATCADVIAATSANVIATVCADVIATACARAGDRSRGSGRTDSRAPT